MSRIALLAVLLALAAPAAAAARPHHDLGACSRDADLVAFSDALDKTTFRGTDVGGLSALTLRGGRARALVDNQDAAPARVYDLRLGRHGRLAPRVTGVTTLRRPDGTPYTGEDFDGEGMAALGGGGLLATSELEPSIRPFGPDGRERGSLPIPERFRVAPAGQASENLTLEGLDRRGRDLWAAMEGPLASDGTNRVRFLHYIRRGHRWVPAGQVGLVTDPGLGVSDVQVVDRHTLLVLERGFEPGVGNTIRVYEAFLDGAEDVTDVASLATPGVRLAATRLLVDLGDCPPSGATSPEPQTNPLLDNVEGMTLGGPDRHGRRSLDLISDDNFSAGQVTRVYRLRVRLHRPPAPALRFATFNASLNRNAPGELLSALADGSDPQISNVAEIIQRVRPDVLNVNELDFVPDGRALALFQRNYLSVSQHGARPIHFPHTFVAPSNTGVASGKDLDNDGQVGTEIGTQAYGNDALGFGLFPGQYGLAVLSRLPIDRGHVRTFQDFLWKDMPGALLPDDPATPAPADWYSPDELALLPLSSKSHWDMPIETGHGTRVHFLVSHPTPPTFDGPEDRNGRRNHDEIRFWPTTSRRAGAATSATTRGVAAACAPASTSSSPAT